MKLLVAVSSCQQYESDGWNNPARECWLHELDALGIDYQFFHGHHSLPGRDIVYVDSPDGIQFMTVKTQQSLRWAYERGYDYVFRCFPDTYCRPDRLLACARMGELNKLDYWGDFRGEHATPDNFCSGGPGYFNSRRAVEQLLDAPIKGVWRDDEHLHQAEDLWVGQILARCYDALKLRYYDDRRFINHGRSNPGPLATNEVVSTHLSCPDPYRPEAMYEKHLQWVQSMIMVKA